MRCSTWWLHVRKGGVLRAARAYRKGVNVQSLSEKYALCGGFVWRKRWVINH